MPTKRSKKSDAQEREMVRIEDWAVGREEGNGFQPPEVLPTYLNGVVFGHPKKADGTRVDTSSLTRFDVEAGIAETSSGTVYKLGVPMPEYAQEMKKLGVPMPRLPSEALN